MLFLLIYPSLRALRKSRGFWVQWGLLGLNVLGRGLFGHSGEMIVNPEEDICHCFELSCKCSANCLTTTLLSYFFDPTYFFVWTLGRAANPLLWALKFLSPDVFQALWARDPDFVPQPARSQGNLYAFWVGIHVLDQSSECSDGLFGPSRKEASDSVEPAVPDCEKCKLFYLVKLCLYLTKSIIFNSWWIL